ncbi:unnamed protein product [Brachionus calyciflorus]|uniref:Reverse transcriptase domain-containing protein n=1 Tax=Brachionus calyciflorus TaxID=104777 RepID=A0A814D531_9BILA|nr:unnamed protein product [Brachionus calyciflorus]
MNYISNLQEINSPEKRRKKAKINNDLPAQSAKQIKSSNLKIQENINDSLCSTDTSDPSDFSDSDVTSDSEDEKMDLTHTNQLEIVDQPTITNEILRFKHIIKLKGIDKYKFSHPDKLNKEIIRNKGNLKIDKAFFNNHNDLLYLFTNDDESYEALSKEWLADAFEKTNGIEVIKPEPKKHHIAIYNFDTNIDIERDEFIKKKLLENNIINPKRVIKKKDNRAIPVIKAQTYNTQAFNDLIKNGLFIKPLHYRVEEWKFEDRPLQCFNCLEFGHVKKDYTHLNLFQNYKFIRNDRESHGGSSGLIIKNDINFTTRKKINESNYEITVVDISLPNHKIQIINVYTPPNSKTDFSFLKEFLISNKKTILLGDFNALCKTWYCNSQNKRGIDLDEITSFYNLSVINNACPTSKKSSNILDLVFVSDNILNLTSDFHVDTSFKPSDHYPISFNLNINNYKKVFKKINWVEFKKNINDIFLNESPDIKTTEDLTKVAQNFETTIRNVLNNNTKICESKNKLKVNLPKQLKALIREKKKLHRLFSKTHNKDIKCSLNKISNRVKKEIKFLSNQKWNDLCQAACQLKPSETKFWHIIKNIENNNSPISNTILPNLDINDSMKADILANHFSKVFKNEQEPKIIKKFFNYKPSIRYNQHITREEITKALKDIKPTQSFGLSKISFKTIKNLPNSALDILSNIYNASFNLGFIPNEWKIAKIKILPKKNCDPNLESSYRPISLLNTISRLLEKIINNRLYNWAEKRKLINPEQSGFRKNHSTQDNIFKIIENTKNGFQKKEHTGIVLFDIEKAFDKAPHKGILKSLTKLRCPKKIGIWISAFLEGRKFCVEINDTLSKILDIENGVPQGSPLSPLLFSLFINDICKILSTTSIKFCMFADDLTIWVTHKRFRHIKKKLQIGINKINSFFKKIGLKINEKKCQQSLFTFKRSTLLNDLKLSINNQTIDYCTNPIILGIEFDTKCSFTKHFENLIKKCTSRVNLLRILAFKSNRLNKNYLLIIYKSLILSLFQYSSLPYIVTTEKIKSKLQVIQNKCLKIILGVPLRTSTTLIHDHFHIQMIDTRLKSLAKNYLGKSIAWNPTIRNLIESNPPNNPTSIFGSLYPENTNN